MFFLVFFWGGELNGSGRIVFRKIEVVLLLFLLWSCLVRRRCCWVVFLIGVWIVVLVMKVIRRVRVRRRVM